MNYRFVPKRPDGFVSRFVTKPVEALVFPVAVRLPLPPVFWTLASFAAKAAAAVFLLREGPSWAVGVLLAASLVLDGLDGDVARARGESSFGGAVLDALADTAGTGFVVAAFAASWHAEGGPLLAAAALVGMEILDRTMHAAKDLSGGLLGEAVRYPRPAARLLAAGFLPWFHMDLLYALVGFAAPAFGASPVAWMVLVLEALSFAFLFTVHAGGCRRARHGPVVWRGTMRVLVARGFFAAALFALSHEAAPAAGLDRAIAFAAMLLEHIAFEVRVLPLVKAAHAAPPAGEERERFFEDLRERDRIFFAEGRVV